MTAVAGAPGGLVASLLRLAGGGHQLPGQDEGAEAGTLGLFLAAHTVGLQQPGALQREIHTAPAPRMNIVQLNSNVCNQKSDQILPVVLKDL